MNTPIFKRFEIRSYEMGLLFQRGEFKGLLAQDRHRFFDPLNKTRVEVVSMRDPGSCTRSSTSL